LIENSAGIPKNTLSQWPTTESAFEGVPKSESLSLKLPSGNTYKVFQINGEDKNECIVLEATDWFDLAFDVLKKTRTGKKIN